MTKAAVAPEQQARVAEAWVRIWASVALDMVKDGRTGEVIAEMASRLTPEQLAQVRGWAESLMDWGRGEEPSTVEAVMVLAAAHVGWSDICFMKS